MDFLSSLLNFPKPEGLAAEPFRTSIVSINIKININVKVNWVTSQMKRWPKRKLTTKVRLVTGVVISADQEIQGSDGFAARLIDSLRITSDVEGRNCGLPNRKPVIRRGDRARGVGKKAIQ
jgi:hypothetical protein